MGKDKLILERADGSRAEIIIDGDKYPEYVRAFYSLMSFATFSENLQQEWLGGNPWDWE